MKGAIAAGHPLTAEAGARVLEEGGNAVDACVAAAFAAWVAESPLTGPGRGRLRARPPRATAGRRGSPTSSSPTPGLGRRRRPAREMHAIDVGFGGDSETTQVFRIGEASCAVPGAAAGLEALHRAYGGLPWRELLAAGDRAGPGGRRADPAAGAPARDPRPDPPPRDGGTPPLQPRRRLTPAAGRRAAAARPRRDARAHRRGGRRVALPRRARRARSSTTVARGRREADARTISPPTASSGGGRCACAYRGHEVISNPPPSSGGILIAYGLALLERVARRRAGKRRGDRLARRGDARADARARRAASHAACIAAGSRSSCSPTSALAAAVRADRGVGCRDAREHAPAGGTTHVSVGRRRGERRVALLVDRLGLRRDRARHRAST